MANYSYLPAWNWDSVHDPKTGGFKNPTLPITPPSAGYVKQTGGNTGSNPINQGNGPVNPNPTPPQQPTGDGGLGDLIRRSNYARYEAPKYYQQYENQINNDFSSRKQALIAKLKSNTNTQLNDLSGMESLARNQNQIDIGTAKNQYQNLRSQNDVERARQIDAVRQASEAAGGYGGGMNVSGTIAANSVAGQNLNNININEQQLNDELTQQLSRYINDIVNARNTINQNASNDELSIMSELDAERARALLQARQYADDIDMKQGEFNYKIGKDQQDRLDSLAARKAEYTGIDPYTGEPTIAKQRLELDKNKYDFEIDSAKKAQDWAKSMDNPEYQSKVLAAKIADAKAQYTDQEMQLYIKDLEQKLYNGQLSADEMIARIEQIKAATDKTKKDTLLMGTTPNTATTFTADDYASAIDKEFTSTIGGQRTQNRDGILNRIRLLEANGVPEPIIDSLLSRYGFPLGKSTSESSARFQAGGYQPE